MKNQLQLNKRQLEPMKSQIPFNTRTGQLLNKNYEELAESTQEAQVTSQFQCVLGYLTLAILAIFWVHKKKKKKEL